MKEIINQQNVFDQIRNNNHKLFVLEYIKCRNITLAYRNVYPNVKNDNVAHASGARLLQNAMISQAINEKFNELWKDKELEIGKTFHDLVSLSRSDIADVVDYKDGVLTVKDFNTVDTKLIKSINYSETETKNGIKRNISITMHDKMKALSEVVRILNMIQDKTELTGTITIIPARKPQKLLDRQKNKAEEEKNGENK